MINVNQITADLARMPDRALQQYAQMHRNDPYIVALALSESNRRRQLRTGAQAGAIQQQPSVVEQDIAQMAPEEVGIGALPERSLTNMAAGGIVAFEEGGEVERYVGGAFVGGKDFIDWLASKNLTGSQYANMLPKDQQALQQAFSEARSAAAPAASTAAPSTAAPVAATAPNVGFGSLVKTGLGAVARSPILNLAPNLFYTSPEEIEVLKNAERARAEEASKTIGGFKSPPTSSGIFAVGQGMSKPDSLRDLEAGLAATTAAAENKEEQTTAEPSKQYSMQDALAEAKKLASSVGGGGGGGIAGLDAAIAKLPTAYDPSADINAAKSELRSALGPEEKFDRAGKLAERKAASQEYYDKANALIDKEAARTKSDKEEAVFMALLEAGLGIMGGKSQYAMENIGQGGKAGLANFSSAMKDIRAASRENEKMRMDLEKTKAADARGDMEAVDRLEDSVKNRRATMMSHLGSGLASLSAAVVSAKGQASSSQVSAAAQLITNNLSNQTQRDVANAQIQAQVAGRIFEANQPTSETRSLQALLDNPKLLAIKEQLLKAAGGAREESTLLSKYIENPLLLQNLQKTDPKMAEYIRQLLQKRLSDDNIQGTTSGASGATNLWGIAKDVSPK